MLNRDLGAWLDEPRRARFIAFALIFVGFCIRAYFAPVGHFSLDLASTFTTARHVAHGVEFPIVGGVTSWGGRVPFPGLFYVTAPPLLFSDSLVVFVLWGVLLATGAMVLFTLLMFERYGPRAGVFTALVVAFNPWFIIGGDSPWAPKLALQVFALFLYALHRVVAQERSRWAFMVPVAICLQAHVYANILITLAVFVAVLACARPRIHWKLFLTGGIVSALSVVPSLWHLSLAGTDSLGKFLTKEVKFSMAREVVQTVYHALIYATAEISYNLRLGFWLHDIPNLYDMKWAGLLNVYDGHPLIAAFVLLTVVLAAWAWGRAAWNGAMAVARSNTRSWDPMAVALVAALVAGAATMLVSKREFHPRYTFIVAWLSIVPLIWLVAGTRPIARQWLRNLVSLWLVGAVGGYLWVASAYYAWAVPPYSVTTAMEVMETVVQRSHGRPFSLRYPRAIAQRGMETIGEELYGDRWTVKPKADIRFYVVASPMSDEALKLSATHGVQTIPVYGAMVLEVPPSAPRPKGRLL